MLLTEFLCIRTWLPRIQ